MVAFMYTSTTAILAPRSLRARVACVITLTWVFTALVPQITTRSDFAISRGSEPASLPVPAMKPAQAGLTQMVEWKPEYFLAWRRRLMPSRMTKPIVPA